MKTPFTKTGVFWVLQLVAELEPAISLNRLVSSNGAQHLIARFKPDAWGITNVVEGFPIVMDISKFKKWHT